MTAPLSFGQLSVLRDVQRFPPESRHQANLSRVVRVGPGVSVGRLRQVFAELRARHEALRTTYDFGDNARPTQAVNPADPRSVELPEITVAPGEDPDAVADRIARELWARPFDLTAEEPMRVAAVLTGGAPSHVVVVLHHIAVDLTALTVLGAEFAELLAGNDLPAPATTPRELAIAQHSAKSRVRRDAAEAHLREVFTSAAHGSALDVVELPAATVKATLYSRVGLPAATVKAASLGISVPSLVLAGYCYAAHQITGAQDILVSVSTANRARPGTTGLINSMNQWARMLSHRADEPFDQFARQLHWASVRAYRHGSYDADVAARVRREVEAAIRPIRPEFFINYIHDDTVEMPETGPAWQVRQHPPAHVGGPGFYLIAVHGRELELTTRTRWEGFDQTQMENFLIALHELLLT